MSWLNRAIALCFCLLAAACSMEAAVNRMVSAEDRAFVERFVAEVRRGNAEALKSEFDPELWEKSTKQLEDATAFYPDGEGRTRIIGFHTSTNYLNGVSTRQKDFTLVTTDEKYWTTTRIVMFAKGGPLRVVLWNVNGSYKPPPELVVFESWERIVPWIQIGGALVLVGFIGLIWWLVRRSRRRHAEGAPQAR